MATRLPGVLANISDSGISTPSTDLVKVLLLGIKLPAGSLAVNTVTKVISDSQAVNLAGEGSQLVQMVRASRAQDSSVDLSIITMDEGAGVAATQIITIVGTTTTANPLIVRIGAEEITIPLIIGADQTDVATAIDAEVNLILGLHVSSSFALGVATLLTKSVGIHGNSILVKVVSTPPGITAVVAAGVAGTLAPDVDAALQSLGATTRYNYIALPGPRRRRATGRASAPTGTPSETSRRSGSGSTRST
jgi:phage tail sheath gpL-like